MKNQKYSRFVLVMFTLIALLYNSWPLGYILNSKTAHYGLASDLDNYGQPYYWLFILGDVLVGASLLAVSFLIRMKLCREFWSKSWSAIILGLFVFGLFTATSAASSNNCSSVQQHICATFHNRTFGADGLESALASVGLLVSMIGVNILNTRTKLNKALVQLSKATLVIWCLSGILFLVEATRNIDVHIAQQLLLIASGVALLVIGINIYLAVEHELKIG